MRPTLVFGEVVCFSRQMHAAVVLQTWCRAYVATRTFVQQKQMAIRLQAFVRRHLAAANYAQSKHVCITLQALYRRRVVLRNRYMLAIFARRNRARQSRAGSPTRPNCPSALRDSNRGFIADPLAARDLNQGFRADWRGRVGRSAGPRAEARAETAAPSRLPREPVDRDDIARRGLRPGDGGRRRRRSGTKGKVAVFVLFLSLSAMVAIESPG